MDMRVDFWYGAPVDHSVSLLSSECGFGCPPCGSIL